MRQFTDINIVYVNILLSYGIIIYIYIIFYLQKVQELLLSRYSWCICLFGRI